MKAITFNICCWDAPNGNSVEERADRLIKILKDYDADIIGLQEYTVRWQNLMKEDLLDTYEEFNRWRDTKVDIFESSPILIKKGLFNVLDSGCFWFSKTPWIESLGDDELYSVNRICQWIYLEEKKTNKRLYFFNLHFGFGDSYQIESVKQLKQTVDGLNADTFIITGDFNTTPDSAAYREAVKYFVDANTLTENYKGNTFHGYGVKEGMQIDFFFISKDTVKANKYHLIDDLVEGKCPSDHYGILLDFEI